MIKALIFDFDGVITDSNNVKTEAFVKLFESHPEWIKEAVKKFHLENGGMSRFDKFRHIYANFLKEDLPEKRFNELCSDFNKLVIDNVVNAPLIDGVEDFLKRNKSVYVMYVVSGTPDYEIKEIVKRRGLDKYFSAVYGSPRSKKELIEEVFRDNKYKQKEVVFLGDSINDYEGALAAGVEFVAKIHDDLGLDLFPGISLKVRIKTMEQFEKYLNDKKRKTL